jgi:hypothetical protein
LAIAEPTVILARPARTIVGHHEPSPKFDEPTLANMDQHERKLNPANLFNFNFNFNFRKPPKNISPIFIN